MTTPLSLCQLHRLHARPRELSAVQLGVALSFVTAALIALAAWGCL